MRGEDGESRAPQNLNRENPFAPRSWAFGKACPVALAATDQGLQSSRQGPLAAATVRRIERARGLSTAGSTAGAPDFPVHRNPKFPSQFPSLGLQFGLQLPTAQPTNIRHQQPTAHPSRSFFRLSWCFPRSITVCCLISRLDLKRV